MINLSFSVNIKSGQNHYLLCERVLSSTPSRPGLAYRQLSELNSTKEFQSESGLTQIVTRQNKELKVEAVFQIVSSRNENSENTEQTKGRQADKRLVSRASV